MISILDITDQITVNVSDQLYKLGRCWAAFKQWAKFRTPPKKGGGFLNENKREKAQLDHTSK